MTELRWLYDRRDLEEAWGDLAAWLNKWQGECPKLCNWVEDNIEETLAFHRFPSGAGQRRKLAEYHDPICRKQLT